MANQDHLDILRQGIDFWNIWREMSGIITPDLSGAKLNNAYLFSADFANVDLSNADLSTTYLNEANFIGAKLVNVNLSAANLSDSYLNDANLNSAQLIGTDLMRTNLSNSLISYANLDGCIIGRTNFVNLDLSTTRGLHTCKHQGSSSINNKTLQQSGRLPKVFLHGIGLTKWEIERNKLLKTHFES